MTLLRSRDVDVVEVGKRVPASARRSLFLVCLGVVLVRATYVLQPLRTDEGGYLLVARQWHTGGEFLYGDYYVDRPPLLMLIFKVAALSEWDALIRVITIVFALGFVVCACWAGGMVGGRAGARWSTVVAGGLMCSPALAADQADGELFAAAIVIASMALALAAWRSATDRRKFGLAFAAGVFAGSAPLAKQNFLEGVLFVAVLLVASSWVHRRAGRREVIVASGALVGALIPHGAVWVWSMSSGIQPGSIWHDLALFRRAAFEVIWASNPDNALVRAAGLVVLALVSGVLPAVVAWLFFARPWRLHSTPEHWAVSAVLLFGLAAVVAGGSYWPHYLLQLAPGVALAAGAAAPAATRAGLWMRRSGQAVVAAALVGTSLVGVVYLTVPWVWFQQRTGEWLAASSTADDSAFVAYGHASILEAADLPSPYPHLWSLPMRTLDPEQERLHATLAGPDAPSWIVQVNGLNSWQIDSSRRLRTLTSDRYRVVAEVCGNPIWLRRDLERRMAPLPLC